MGRLRNRLIAAFLAASVLPLAATIWITTSLIDRSLEYATTSELDRLSRTLEETGRQLYQHERDALKQDAVTGRTSPTRYEVAQRPLWPEPVQNFWESGESERFQLAGSGGDRVDYLWRRPDGSGLDAYSRDLRGIKLSDLSGELRQARALVESMDGRDLRRGFTLTLLLLLASIWILSLAPLVLIAHRVSRPIQQLTAGLNDFAAGDWSRQIDTGDVPGRGADETRRAVDAFNHMAGQLRQQRERLVHLTQMASWQSLARKTAHELKNSLTPIRLTVEEMLARQPPADRVFMAQAVHIVVSEIDSLERRVRAFSEFASEPPISPQTLDVNELVTERVAFLKSSHPEVVYQMRPAKAAALVYADIDQVKSILTNLLQNAADAAGATGAVLVITRSGGAGATTPGGSHVTIEIHDSGPGVSAAATATLFEPSITFKKHGMGLGLSIVKKNALLAGGDVMLIEGELGGAGFRVILPSGPKA